MKRKAVDPNTGDPNTRRFLSAAGLAVSLIVIALQAPAVASTTSVVASPPSATTTVVSNGVGNQSDPHVSGDLVAYVDDTTGAGEYRIRYQNLATGHDEVVPNVDGGQDALADVSGTTITYVHFSEASTSVWTFDTAGGQPPVELDPQPNTNRFQAAVGGSTIAVQDFGLNGSDLSRPGIVAYDRIGGTHAQLTPLDAADFSSDPAVSPLGTVVSWTTCDQSQLNCHVFDSTFGGGTWTAPRQLSETDGTYDKTSDTNGAVVVYAATRAGERDIYWQSVDGGTEGHISLPGADENPNISGRLITFEHVDSSATVPQTDVYAYDLETGTLYRLSNTSGSESLSDVSVDATGQAHVVWSVLEDSGDNIYASSFRLPTVNPLGYRICPLYDEDVSHRSGSTVPIKVQVCDPAGANVSSPALVVSAAGLTKRDSSASSVTVNDSGNANPDGNFRYDAGLHGYIYNLSTKGLTTGTWVLGISVAGDHESHSVRFDVR